MRISKISATPCKEKIAPLDKIGSEMDPHDVDTAEQDNRSQDPRHARRRLNIDLKDNDGGFNCGKPAGYIQDFKALPESMQDLIKQIKRVRVVFGTVELIDPVDAAGKAVDLSSTPFIWEVENRDAFKSIGALFTKLGKMRRLPPQHTFTATTAEQSLPNGSSFYLPETALDLQTTLELDDAAQETLGNFLAWVTNYNEYISNAWDENAHKHEDVDKEGVEEFIDITEEDFA